MISIEIDYDVARQAGSKVTQQIFSHSRQMFVSFIQPQKHYG
jgi:hypothetical protein